MQAVRPPQPRSPAPRPIATPTPIASPTPVATPTPVETDTPSPKPSPALSEATLQSSSIDAGQASTAEYYYAFPDPGAFFDPASLEQADSTGSELVPLNGITNMSRIERVGLDRARDEYLPLYPGGAFTQVGSCGEVYEVRKDGAVGYVVLLEEDGIGLATFVVEWNRNPALAEAPDVGGVSAA